MTLIGANEMKEVVVGLLVLIALYAIGIHFQSAREPSALNGVALIIAIPTVYFLPTLVAWVRKHHAMMAVFLTNLLLGWTFLGWVGALVWSVMPVKTT